MCRFGNVTYFWSKSMKVAFWMVVWFQECLSSCNFQVRKKHGISSENAGLCACMEVHCASSIVRFNNRFRVNRVQNWKDDRQSSRLQAICCEEWNKTPAKHRDIFRETLFAKKVWRRKGSNPRPTDWETRKNLKHQPGFETLLAGKAISEVHFTPWSGDKVEFWQNWLKKRVTDHDFPPPLMWAENNKGTM